MLGVHFLRGFKPEYMAKICLDLDLDLDLDLNLRMVGQKDEEYQRFLLLTIPTRLAIFLAY